jgi:EAL domain-containing protein (putative c-di-GMP-specific phosphodiesterase class I)
VCGELASAEAARAVADRVARAVNAPVTLRGHTVHPSASVGIAVGDGGSSLATLLRHADAAMYQAKQKGKNQSQLADVTMDDAALRLLELESALHLALDGNELLLAYQPTFDLLTGAVVGAEALLRWRHPERGVLEPGAFLDVAEERGLIVPIGHWALREACAQASRWRDRFGPRSPRVWVNISSRQLGRNELSQRLLRVLHDTNLEPKLVGIELNERQALTAGDSARLDLNELPRLGVSVAIDDFGTGHNSFDYLRTIDADTIKIDRSFVSAITDDDRSATFCSTIIDLARTLDLTVVAEGVETHEQARLLTSMGCHQAQGFLFSPPVAADRVTELLDQAAAARGGTPRAGAR